MATPAIPQRRILVVDDEPSILDAVKLLLEIDGHEVATVSGGKEALACLAKQSFDLVITDYSMPVMRGDELAARIKTQNPALPVAVLTAHLDMLPNPLPNVDGIIGKPFLLEHLREAIARLTRARK